MTKKALLLLLCAPWLALGCTAESDPETTGPSIQDEDETDADDESSAGGESSSTSEGPQTTATEATTTPAETDSATTLEEETESDSEDSTPPVTTITFIGDIAPDIGFECSVWDQDCGRGEKCMPWANDGGNTWNATKCVPLNGSPGAVGDACMVEGSGVTGIDTCAASAMCWNIDGETNTGTCIGFCSGTESNPLCDDPSTTCSITNDGALILCLPDCDPLLQDCADGEGCYGITDGYVCAPDASGEMGGYGDPCEAINVCDPGHECMPAAAVPDCAGAQGCCTPFCDITEAPGGCPGAGGGQECLAAFAEGDAPPGYEDLGVCSIPN